MSKNARHDQDSGSPNHLSLGGATRYALAKSGNFDRAKYERLAQMGGFFGKIGQQVLAQNPVEPPAPVAPAAPTADISAPAAPTGSYGYNKSF